MNNNLDIRICDSNIYAFSEFLLKNDDLFSPKLTEQVNISDYVKKIFKYAIRYEAYINQTLVGAIAVYNNQGNGFAFVTLVLCDKKYLHRGIITKLYKYAEKHLVSNNVKEIKLETQSSNFIAQRFYAKMGYNIFERNITRIVYKKSTCI